MNFILHKKFIVCSVLALLFQASSSFANAGEHAGEMNWNYAVILPLVNLFMLGGILYYAFRKSVKDFFAHRAEEIRDAVLQGARVRQEMTDNLSEAEQKLSRVDADARQLFSSFEKEAEALRQKIVRDAEAQAHRITEVGKQMGEQEQVKLKQELKEEVIAQAIQNAEGRIQARLTPDTDRSWVKGQMNEIGGLL